MILREDDWLSPALGSDGKYQVILARVRFNTVVADDEIDMDSGFLMMPQAVPVATSPSTDVGAGPTDVLGGSSIDPGSSGPSPNDVLQVQKSVEIAFSADRDQLFSAWNAIANLADLAGRINVTVIANSAAGFDKTKLENGVLEPLREFNLIK